MSFKQFDDCEISRARRESARLASFVEKLACVCKTGFSLFAAHFRAGHSCRPLSYIFTSIIYASARALRSDQCKPLTFGGLGPLQPPFSASRPCARRGLTCERSGPARRRNYRRALWRRAGPRSRAATSWPNVPRPVDGTRTDGDGWALSGRRGGRHLYELASYPNSSVETLLLLTGTC